jgi:hypothetical protein
MCDPGTALLAGGAAISAVGAISSGSAESKTDQQNADYARQQAQQRQQKANFDSTARLAKMNFDIEQSQRNSTRKMGTIKASIAGSGLDVNSFSNVLADDAKEASLEVQSIRYTGNLDAYQIQYQGASEVSQLGHQVAADEANAASAEEGGYLKAAGVATTTLGNAFKSKAAVSASDPNWGYTVSLGDS